MAGELPRLAQQPPSRSFCERQWWGLPPTLGVARFLAVWLLATGLLATRLVRRQVSPDVCREVKTSAPVIEIASASPRPQFRRVRSFAPRRRAI